jgi:hypothetical protein
MPRNYDEIREQEDRTFIIRGETFTLRRCRPEALGEIVEIEKKFEKAKTFQEVADINEERLIFLINDQNGAVERWQKIRADEENPVTYGEITDLSRWAVEQITGLPTMQASPSQGGPGTTAASSKAG